MTGRAWTPARYPKVVPGIQARFNRAMAELGVANRAMRLSIPALGETRIVCRDVGRLMAPHRGALRWRICDPQRVGWLSMDSLACLTIVSSTLGLDVPTIDRHPTRIEAGIVAASLAAVVRAVNPHTRLSLEPVEGPGDDGAEDQIRERGGSVDDELIELELELACKAFDERVHAQVPVAWIPRCLDSVLAAEAIRRDLRISLALEAARTTLAMADWSHADAGDAVIFDGHAFPPGSGDWSLQVRCGDHEAAAIWNDANELRLVSDLGRVESAAPRVRHRAMDPPGVNNDEARAMYAGTEGMRAMANDERLATSSRFEMIAAAPVEIVAEVGRLVLRAEEVMALQRGSVIPLDRSRTRLVELRIADKLWARGEMVEADGELAVRLTELAAPDAGIPRDGKPPASP